MDNKKSFDKTVYNNAYNKTHYTNCSLRIKPDISDKIAAFCSDNGYSKNDFFVKAALYCIDNGIDLTETPEK